MTTRKVKMLNGKILVRMHEPVKASASGLIQYPEDAMTHVNNTGEVVDVGDKYNKKGKLLPKSLEPGDRVLVLRFLEDQATSQGVQRAVGEDNLAVLDESDILLVYTADDEHRLRMG